MLEKVLINVRLQFVGQSLMVQVSWLEIASKKRGKGDVWAVAECFLAILESQFSLFAVIAFYHLTKIYLQENILGDSELFGHLEKNEIEDADLAQFGKVPRFHQNVIQCWEKLLPDLVWHHTKIIIWKTF